MTDEEKIMLATGRYLGRHEHSGQQLERPLSALSSVDGSLVTLASEARTLAVYAVWREGEGQVRVLSVDQHPDLERTTTAEERFQGLLTEADRLRARDRSQNADRTGPEESDRSLASAIREWMLLDECPAEDLRIVRAAVSSLRGLLPQLFDHTQREPGSRLLVLVKRALTKARDATESLREGASPAVSVDFSEALERMGVETAARKVLSELSREEHTQLRIDLLAYQNGNVEAYPESANKIIRLTMNQMGRSNELGHIFLYIDRYPRSRFDLIDDGAWLEDKSG